MKDILGVMEMFSIVIVVEFIQVYITIKIQKLNIQSGSFYSMEIIPQ